MSGVNANISIDVRLLHSRTRNAKYKKHTQRGSSLDFLQNHQTLEGKNPFQGKLGEKYSEIKSVSQSQLNQIWIFAGRGDASSALEYINPERQGPFHTNKAQPEKTEP